MNWKTPVSLALVVVIVVAALLLFRGCDRPDQTEADKIPAPVIKTMDSLNAAKPAFQHQQDSLVTIVIHDTIQAVALRKAELKVKASAAEAGRLADSLARVATSATEWHTAYDARTRQADSLTVAVRLADSTANAERHARESLAVAYGADTTRRVKVEQLNSDLRAAIAKLEKPCRLLGPIPCPSRTASAGLGLLGGILAGKKL